MEALSFSSRSQADASGFRILSRHRATLIATALVVAVSSAFSLGLAQAQDTPEASPTPAPVLSTPSLTLTAVPGIGPAPLTVGFLAEMVDPEQSDITSFQLTFGDGNVSTLPPPYMVFNTYTQPGTYLATLTATTLDGRSASAVAGIVVTAPH